MDSISALQSVFRKLDAEIESYFKDGKPKSAAALEAIHALRTLGVKLSPEYKVAKASEDYQ